MLLFSSTFYGNPVRIRPIAIPDKINLSGEGRCHLKAIKAIVIVDNVLL